ncbi:porin [uncultured Zoogloea sp.]|uniref:porin n=1 Tax=uncultured Zoogloea sp. TaxID=160237 RepID=UPI00260CB7F1|nr:porin [uncultured Zoogloea sp.]
MQKKLIALAVAGLASTGAFAQANVTVYGVADASFDVVRTSNAVSELGNTTRVSTNSSLIGFKGAESLGNGLTAVFQYESGVGFDNTGALGATRDSFVGLAGGFGTVVLGNLTGPTRALGAAVDVNAGATGIGANSALLGKLGNNLLGTTNTTSGSYTAAGNANCDRNTTCTSIFDTRWKNAIAYVSPTFAGLNVTAAYVANENKTFNNNGFGTAYNPSNTKGYDVGLKYANGPAMAAVTYNAVSLGNEANTDVSDFRVGGVYDFGMASVRAVFDRARADHFGGNTVTQNVFGLGGTFNVTPAGKLLAQAYFARDLKVNGSSSKDSGAKLFEVGYEHSLSKRTMLKAVYAHLNNDDKASYDFGINAVGVNSTYNGGATGGATIQGVQLGLRHSF